jgi:hypothetical protein
MCERLSNPIYPISTTNENLNAIPFDFNDLILNENSYFLKTNQPTTFYFSRLILDFSPEYCLSPENKFTDTGNLIIQQFKAGPFETKMVDKNNETYLHFRDIVIPVDIEFDYDSKKSPENMNLKIDLKNDPNTTIQFKNYFATNGDNTEQIMIEMVHLNEFFKVKNSPFFQKVIESIVEKSELSKQTKFELAGRISDHNESQNPRKNYIDKMERMKDVMDVILTK